MEWDDGCNQRQELTLMLSPFAVTGSLVVNASEEVEVFQGHLFGVDAQLLVQFSLSSALDAQNGSVQSGSGLSRDTEGVRTAGVCPHVWKRSVSKGEERGLLQRLWRDSRVATHLEK